MNQYCQNVLKAELAKSDYNGKTADEGWAWLMDPITEQVVTPTGTKLTPIIVAATLGPAKANILAGKVAAMLPNIAESLMRDGVDLAHPATTPFLNLMVGDGLTVDDISALVALGSKTITKESKPRFNGRFFPRLWPHVDVDGNFGGENSPSINGFPNTITREDFNVAWAAAGRI